MPCNTCELHVGRLLEIRVEAGYREREEVRGMFAEIANQIARLPSSQRLVIVTDWRRCAVMNEGAAEELGAAIRGTNPRVERSAALLPQGSSVAVLQFMRLLRESNNCERRGFSSPLALVTWLSEVLTPEEAARLQAFVADDDNT